MNMQHIKACDFASLFPFTSAPSRPLARRRAACGSPSSLLSVQTICLVPPSLFSPPPQFHYFASHPELNAYAVVPVGPGTDYDEPHDRARKYPAK